jgi:hypothetical protein
MLAVVVALVVEAGVVVVVYMEHGMGPCSVFLLFEH